MAVSTSRTGPCGSLAGPASSTCLRDSNDSTDTHAASSAGFRPSHRPRRRHSAASRSSSEYSRVSRWPGRGDRVAVQVAELVEHGADPVEGPGDHVPAPGDLALQVVGLLLLPEVALGVPGVLLAVRALVARVTAQPAAQLGDVALASELVVVRPCATAPATRSSRRRLPHCRPRRHNGSGCSRQRGRLRHRRSHALVLDHRRRHRSGGGVAAASAPRPSILLRIAETRSRRCFGDRSLNELGDADPVDGAGRHREVGRGQLLELAVHGEHQGAVGAVGRELGAGRRRVEHHREARPGGRTVRG